ncbi:AIPR family protein [Agromyces binzhouensis]|uniref:AIPR family protein n=1 Tax=Agromyces binzhouensis TaxID=1817495 RepID=UPI003628B33F
MTDEITEYRDELANRIRAAASVGGAYTEEAFVSELAAKLSEAEEVNALTPCYFEGTGGRGKRLRIDAYDFDDEDGHAVVAVAAFSESDEIQTVTNAEATRRFGQAQGWVESALDGSLFDLLEESSQAFEVAESLRERREQLFKVRIYLLTNDRLSSKIKEFPSVQQRGITFEFHPWDIDRFHRVEASSLGREEIDVDLREWAPDGIRFLRAAITSAEVSTLLAVVPGSVLAGIYRRYGTRVLESNVRSFLSTRGKVNKGIRGTLLQQPEMFLSYNNGITATASRVTIDSTPDGPVLTSIRDLQIVNGGQTTASLFYVDKDEKSADLTNVFVQMKLIIVEGEFETDLVPKISRFANSQNAVSEADFFSNHEFHQRMEEKSRRLLAPAQAGSAFQTKWYYERTRGQYQSEKAKLTPAGARKFEAQYPRSQVVTKTDAAKYLVSWAQQPHVVSAGAQKNFLEFAKQIEEAWKSDKERFGDDYFRSLVAKGILFNAIRLRVMKSDWYTSGYLANIVTYTMAKLAHEAHAVSGRGDLDFGRIWLAQSPDEGLLEITDRLAQRVFLVLTDEDRPVLNVTEWAKREKAWEAVRAIRFTDGAMLAQYTVAGADAVQARRDERRDQRLLTGIAAQMHVVNQGSRYWNRLRDFARKLNLVSSKELGILAVAIGESGNGVPSELQSAALVDLEKRAKDAGFTGN